MVKEVVKEVTKEVVKCHARSPPDRPPGPPARAGPQREPYRLTTHPSAPAPAPAPAPGGGGGGGGGGKGIRGAPSRGTLENVAASLSRGGGLQVRPADGFYCYNS